jgi:hypothetical protein
VSKKGKGSADDIGLRVDWLRLHRELCSPGATLKNMWLQSWHKHCSYQKFRRAYLAWLNQTSLLTRSQHRAGKKMFVGFVSIKDSHIVDTETGQTWTISLFLAVLGASGYGYAQPCLARDIDNWVSGHINAIQVFNGVADRLVSRLTDEDMHLVAHSRYRELACSCQAKIETNPCQSNDFRPDPVFEVMARWFRKVLCNRVFFGWMEFHTEIEKLTARFNGHRLTALSQTRLQLLETVERASLRLVPPTTDGQEQWRTEHVIGTHIKIEDCYYSVPPVVVGQQIDIKISPEFICIYFQERLITSHPRQELSSSIKHSPTWSPHRVLTWAQKIGPSTSHLARTILTQANDSQSGVHCCLGLLSLETKYGRERLESACRKATASRRWTVKSIRSMLANRLDLTFVQLQIPGLVIPSQQIPAREKRH